MTGAWNKREGAVADALGQDFRLLRRRNKVFLTGDHQRRHFDLGQRAARIGVIERANRCPRDEFRGLNDFSSRPFEKRRRRRGAERDVRQVLDGFLGSSFVDGGEKASAVASAPIPWAVVSTRTSASTRCGYLIVNS